MKQQINLFQPAEEKANFTFRQMLTILGAFLGIILIATLYDGFKYYRASRELSLLQKQENEKNLQLAQVTTEVPPEQTRNQIIEEIKRYDVIKNQKVATANALVNEQKKNLNFSIFLEALSKEKVEGLWITKFEIKDEGNFIALEGNTLKPTFVPDFISALGNEPVFQGKSFKVFKLKLNDKTNLLEFTIQTDELKV